ncbi:dicarboxylate transporter 1 [Actinidia rufa]|uniref:Dicarboxylate transporter 1 n=1 Tax=Actinidia rufa TaxID=165716 RepID=A0A7J0GHJ5_9ERIC|nr:dicarboxylate transporter 1 [Actinidia rufa]
MVVTAPPSQPWQGDGDKASDGLDRLGNHPLVRSSAVRSLAKRVAIAVDLPDRHRRNHHAAAFARRGGTDGARRLCPRQNPNLRRRLLSLRRPHPLAHRDRLLRPQLQKNRHRSVHFI